MQDSPKVFISILNWNGLDDTVECLDSIFRMDYPNYVVVVVDNASSDGSPSIIREKYPQVVLIVNKKNHGFAGGNNITLRYAIDQGADYVWLLNNDAIVEINTLSALVEVTEKDPSIGLGSPIIKDYNNRLKTQFRGSYIDWKRYEIIEPHNNSGEIARNYQSGRDVCLWGTALLIKQSVIKRIGYLDEKYFAYMEDFDYSIRALKAGFRNILYPCARIFHKNDPYSNKIKSPYFYYYQIRNAYLMRNKICQGWWRINKQRKFLSSVLYHISYFVKSHKSHKEFIDAVITGAWHGITHVGGKMSSSPKVPYILEKMLVFFGSYPPFFWSYLIEGNLDLIIKKSAEKFRDVTGKSS